MSNSRHVITASAALLAASVAVPLLGGPPDSDKGVVISEKVANTSVQTAKNQIELQRDKGASTSAADVSLAGPAGRVAPGTRVETLRSRSDFSMVGLTWRGQAPTLAIRHRQEKGWSRWQEAEALTDLPSADRTGKSEGNGRRGTEALWLGRTDAVQVRITVTEKTGDTRDLRAVLIDPGANPKQSEKKRQLTLEREDASAPQSPQTQQQAQPNQQAQPTTPTKPNTAPQRQTQQQAPATTYAAAPMPKLFIRADWGADESWRTSAPRYHRELKQVHVHHTATSNSYTRADVPALIRGMYRYHTKSLGWSDIGYNFLVDKFGRAWVGRAGGPKRIVRGAHTLGFNHKSVGISMIGSFTSTPPTDLQVLMVSRLAAWKLDMYKQQAIGSTVMTSEGSDRYGYGRTVRLPIIDGHRDTNYTTCPGDKGYAMLPRIRRLAQDRVDAFN